MNSGLLLVMQYSEAVPSGDSARGARHATLPTALNACTARDDMHRICTFGEPFIIDTLTASHRVAANRISAFKQDRWHAEEQRGTRDDATRGGGYHATSHQRSPFNFQLPFIAFQSIPRPSSLFLLITAVACFLRPGGSGGIGCA